MTRKGRIGHDGPYPDNERAELKRETMKQIYRASLDDVVNKLVNRVHTHMMENSPGWSFEKPLLWFGTKNPLLGNMTPDDMILTGRHKKLEKFIDNCVDGNIA